MASESRAEPQMRILVAEDSPTQAAQLAALLEDNGYSVEVAVDGRAALEAARARRPTLVISDVVMPELDGYGLCRELKRNAALKDIPAILVTTLSDPLDVIRGLECGADNFIRKPYEARYLLSRVQYLLMNLELRKNQKMQMGLEINLGGKRQFITAERQQILDLLISTYEQAVVLNEELGQRERQLERSNQVLQGLYRMADGLNAVVNERQIAQTALERALELPGVQAGWIALREGEDRFRIAATRNLPPALAAPGAFDGACSCQRKLLAGELGPMTNMLECERLQRAQGETWGLKAHASVPIVMGDEALGVMNLVGAEQGIFDEADAANLRAVGNQLGIAFARARLHEGLERLVEERTAKLAAEVEQRRRAEEEVRLLLAVTEVTSSAPDVPAALEAALGTICATAGWDCGEGWLQEGGIPQPVAVWHVADEPAIARFAELGRTRRISIDTTGSLILATWQKGTPSWIPDLTQSGETVRFLRRADAAAAGLRAVLAVTVPGHDGKPVAALLLLRRAVGTQDERMVRLIEGVARHLGVAIERKRAADKLATNEALLRKVLDTLPVGVRVADSAGGIVMGNPALESIWGGAGPAARKAWWPDTARRLEPGQWPLDRAVREAKTTLNELVDIECSDGSRKSILNSAAPIIGPAGEIAGGVEVIEDVTERRAQEKRIARLSRMQAMLSGINSTIVRVKSRDELFNATCRLVTDTGGFLFGHIRMLSVDRATLVPAAYAGPTSLEIREVDVRDPAGLLLVAQAYHNRRVVACNDLAADTDRSPLRLEAMQAGCQALAALPIRVGDAVLGVVTIASREKNAFDDEEIRLLEELAGDVGFALDHLAKEERISYLAFYDSLTELANRALFHDRIDQLARAGRAFALAVVNLVGFRRVNETFGMHGGDALLKHVAGRLAQHAAAENVGRIGADTFGAIREGIGDAAAVARWVEWLRGGLTQPYDMEGTELRLDLRIGVAMFPDDGADALALFANAESALKRARKAGEPFVAYRPELNARVAERLMLENRLRRAVEDEQFVLHYQPKLDLGSGAIIGAEALIRWQDPENGLISPGQFVPVLEETGLILDVGQWALKSASAAFARWRAAGLACPEVAVNVSQIQMRRPDFAESAIAAIAAGGGQGGVSIEITETLIMESVEASIAKLRTLRDAGVGIAVDDFGTGYSSLAYLSKLPIDALKIDRSFIVEMPRDPNAMTLVSTIITLANTYRLKVIAEGVDSEEQLKLLRLLRCEQVQGFLFHKPLPAHDFEQLLRGLTRA